MMTAYFSTPFGIQSNVITLENRSLLNEAKWIDLLNPTDEEEKWVEQIIHLNIPSKKEMQEIEISSRLYRKNGILFMIASMIAHSDTHPISDAISFVLTKTFLVTIRYIDPKAFSHFKLQLTHREASEFTPIKLLINLLETTIDRLADTLEKVIQKTDQLSQTIFVPSSESRSLKYQQILQDIGKNDDLGTKARESLISFNLLVSYLGSTTGTHLNEELKSRLKMISTDIISLSDHATFIASKTSFLLNATLGFVNIEQNNIIKIFSVAAVIFLPPTLIASIYGMNFKVMPELEWLVGYPVALGLMVFSAWLPFKYFKKRKWL